MAYFQEKQEMLELIDQQLQTEGYELAYRLALEQNEEVEKLRKVSIATDGCGFKPHNIINNNFQYLNHLQFSSSQSAV